MLLATAVWSDPWRIATYHAPFHRKGPGLLVRDLSDRLENVAAPLDIIAAAAPDVILLTDVDWDADGAALIGLVDQLQARGLPLKHAYSRKPNTGVPTGRDIDGDGRNDGPRDAQGYGRFTGQGGMALLSRWPIDEGGVVDLSGMLWRAVPDSRILPEDPALDLQRLSSAGHWIVPIAAPVPFVVLAYHATPPVFDGPEDRNGRRNADETALWQHFLDGALPVAVPAKPVVVLGNANLDPDRGEGLRQAMRSLLEHPRLQDPVPQGPFGAATVDWPIPTPGRLRVSYVLPDRAFRVIESGVHGGRDGPVHKLVWVDLMPGP